MTPVKVMGDPSGKLKPLKVCYQDFLPNGMLKKKKIQEIMARSALTSATNARSESTNITDFQ